MNIVVTDKFKFYEKEYQGGFTGVKSPEALRNTIYNNALSMTQEELIEYYVESETDREYGFRTK